MCHFFSVTLQENNQSKQKIQTIMKLKLEIEEGDFLSKPILWLASAWCSIFGHKWLKCSSGYWCKTCGKKVSEL